MTTATELGMEVEVKAQGAKGGRKGKKGGKVGNEVDLLCWGAKRGEVPADGLIPWLCWEFPGQGPKVQSGFKF